MLEQKKPPFRGPTWSGRAANLFSAPGRLRALASLALAHSGIVFLLLHLSLLHGDSKGWMFTELAASDSPFADRHGDLLPGTFLTSWWAFGKTHQSFFMSEGNHRTSPGKVSLSPITYLPGREASERKFSGQSCHQPCLKQSASREKPQGHWRATSGNVCQSQASACTSGFACPFQMWTGELKWQPTVGRWGQWFQNVLSGLRLSSQAMWV